MNIKYKRCLPALFLGGQTAGRR